MLSASTAPPPQMQYAGRRLPGARLSCADQAYRASEASANPLTYNSNMLRKSSKSCAWQRYRRYRSLPHMARCGRPAASSTLLNSDTVMR